MTHAGNIKMLNPSMFHHTNFSKLTTIYHLAISLTSTIKISLDDWTINTLWVVYILECFMFTRAKCVLSFWRRDVLQNTGYDGLKIAELSVGPEFRLKLREARRKEAFHTITDFTLLHVLAVGNYNSNNHCKFLSKFAVKFAG